MQEVSGIIDHTLLKPEAMQNDIKKLVLEAKKFGFWSCCVNPCWVSFAAKELKGTDIKVCSVIGFPFGTTNTKAKSAEAIECIKNGADELDMVINIGFLKSGFYKKVKDDIQAVVDSAKGKIVKVIIEAGVLNKEEKIKACKIVVNSGAHFVKTSTGFGYSGATIEDVKLMRKVVGPDFGVKASGGIRTWDQVIKFIEAGASRIGTSHGVQIVRQKL